MRASGRSEAVWACERGVFVNAGGLHSNISSGLGLALGFFFSFLLLFIWVLRFFQKTLCYLCGFFDCSVFLLVIYIGFLVVFCFLMVIVVIYMGFNLFHRNRFYLCVFFVFFVFVLCIYMGFEFFFSTNDFNNSSQQIIATNQMLAADLSR